MREQVQLVLGIGSNHNRKQHIQQGVDALFAEFGELKLSPVYRSVAFGFEGPDFYNLVCLTSTVLGVDEVQARLKSIETAEGRRRNNNRFSSRTLDIDILLYGDENLRKQGYDIPREEILQHSFVLKPLADLLPDTIHPMCGKSFLSIWQSFNGANTDLMRLVWKPELPV